MKATFFLSPLLGLSIFGLISCVATKPFEYNFAGVSSKIGPSMVSRANGIQIAICDESGNIKITKSLKPESWSTPTTILTGANSLTENILLNFEDTLYLFARSSDNRIIYSKNLDNGNWSPQHTINIEPNITGEITTCITRAVNHKILFHFAYVTENGVYYKIFDGNNIIHSTYLESYHGCQLVAMGNEEIALSVINEKQLRFFEGNWTNWNLSLVNVRNVGNDVSIGSVISQSNIIYFNKKFHIALCYATKGPENGFTNTYSIEHLQFGRQNEDVVIKSISSFYSPNITDIKPTLALYRNKVIALWPKNPTGNIGISRWNYYDPNSPWIPETKLHLPGTTHTIAAATFNKRNDPTISYLNDYGNDLFISSTKEDGAISFDNFSRSLSKELCFEQFQMYAAMAPNEPRVEANLLQEQGPFISEIGYNLFMFPDWFINNFYKRMIDGFCRTGVWAPCTISKFPVVVMPSGRVFIARGIWISRQSDYLQIFEELGHYMSIFMGIGNASAGPIQLDSDNVGITLTELQKAYAIFGGNHGSCSGCNNGQRCVGFTGISCNYDVGGREHSFIYTLYFYISRGDEIRQFIQEDLSRGSDQLKQKYDWVKKNIFNSIEFTGDQEPL